MRLDYFLIWSNGLKHKYEIFSIIRSTFEIKTIRRVSVGDIKRFVRKLYQCDTVPFNHLVAKTRYLLKLKPEIGFVLVENPQPDEQMVGSGAFLHKQCMVVNSVKAKIRQRFNPQKDQHVVHASDYESQTQYTMDLLKIKLAGKNPPAEKRTAKLSDLRANILGSGLVPIEKTPHDGYVIGNKQPYKDYYETNWGVRLTDDHAPEAFDLLIKGFSYLKPIRVCKNRIIDGVHRAAILQSKAIDVVQVEDISL